MRLQREWPTNPSLGIQRTVDGRRRAPGLAHCCERANCTHMDDRLLRAAVLGRLRAKYATHPNALVVEELGLRHGATRADIALINSRLEGFEIKGATDRLTRLPRQAAVYSSVFDRVTLIVAGRHAAAAVEIVPAWWGLVTAHAAGQHVFRLVERRTARPNPCADLLAIAKLLWRGEALALLETLGQSSGLRSARRGAIHERLATVLPPDQLKATVRQTLRSRTEWRSAAR